MCCRRRKQADYRRIEKIKLYLKEENVDKETDKSGTGGEKEVSVKVEIPPVKRADSGEKKVVSGTDSLKEQQLKRKVAQYYGLEEACIEIGGKMTREKWLFLLLLGVILMILSMPFPGSKTKNRGTAAKGENVSLWTDTALQEVWGKMEHRIWRRKLKRGNHLPVQLLFKPAADYEKELEDRIAQLLKSVEGVGKVDVMVVLSSSSEKVSVQTVRKIPVLLRKRMHLGESGT